MPPEVPAYLTVIEAARYLRLSKPMMDIMRCRGTGPKFAKIGFAVRYRRADLDAFMAARLRTSTSEVA